MIFVARKKASAKFIATLRHWTVAAYFSNKRLLLFVLVQWAYQVSDNRGIPAGQARRALTVLPVSWIDTSIRGILIGRRFWTPTPTNCSADPGENLKLPGSRTSICAWRQAHSSRRGFHLADTTRWIYVGLTLVQRRRRWTNGKPTLIQCIVPAGCSAAVQRQTTVAEYLESNQLLLFAFARQTAVTVL